MMVTDDHKEALKELLKLVQSKMGMGKEGEQIPSDVDTEMQPMGDEPEDEAEMKAEEVVGEEDAMPKTVQEVEESEDGLDPSMIEDMKKTFGGREDTNMPFGKKGVRMGVTQISAIPMKKPMRR